MMKWRMWGMVLGVMLVATQALAVPDTSGVRVTDVTPRSFCLVWQTDVAAEPEIELFADAEGLDNRTADVVQSPMDGATEAVAGSARAKGVMMVRVSGLMPGTAYYVRALTRDPNDPSSISYSPILSVQTAQEALVFTSDQGTLHPLENDLVSFRVYVPPAETAVHPRQGDLILMEAPGAAYPLAAFVGQGCVAPEGLVDLNNLFDLNGHSMEMSGGEVLVLRIYRGQGYQDLLHYRRVPTDAAHLHVQEVQSGFYADINLDGKVDAVDFALFRPMYQQGANDAEFNPDYNLVAITAGETGAGDRIDALDFARFANQYGRSDVQ